MGVGHKQTHKFCELHSPLRLSLEHPLGCTCGRFQNSLDLALVGSTLVLLLLGGIYAFATDASSANRLVVEYVMLASMVGVLLLGTLYVAYAW